MTQIVFMGTPDFAVPSLQTLIKIGHVVGVVTQPDRPSGRGRLLRPPPVKEVAVRAGIPVYQPKSLRTIEAAAPVTEWRPDIIIVAAFGQILRPHLLDMPLHGCLNVHASLLPRWRGPSPIQHAILSGDTTTGISLMHMDAGMDTGAVFSQRTIPIRLDETAATLHDRLAELGAAMLKACLADILSGHLVAAPQDDTGATYAPLIKKQDGRLDWGKTTPILDRQVRAMTPWPGAFTTWHGQNLKIQTARPINDHLPSGEPGLVVSYRDSVAVLTQDGGLELGQIQLAGKRVMVAKDFIRGQPDFINSKLGE